MKFLNTIYGLAAVLLATGLKVVAQERQPTRNIIILEMQDSLGTWRNSANAAGLAWDTPVDFSTVSGHYQISTGDFKRPQAPSRQVQQGIFGAGNTKLNGYYIQGSFSYVRDKRENASFNASRIDPSGAMPYMVLDSNASDWSNQHYSMDFQLATPQFGGRWSLGLSTRYQAASGAKQRDIRAENGYYSLQISPSVVYAFSPKHLLGMHLAYDNTKEESGNRNVNVYVDQGYYFNYGLGHAIPYVGSGVQMDYQSDRWGGGLQYAYKGAWDLFVSSNIDIGAMNAGIGFVESRTEGTLLSRTSTSKLQAKRMDGNRLHLITLGYDISDNKGIEYWNEFVAGLESEGYINRYKAVRSTYKRQAAQARYTFLTQKEELYDWKFELGWRYDKQDDRYLMPISSFTTENIGYGLTVQKALTWAHSTLVLGGKLWRQQNLSGAYAYGGMRAEEWPVTQLMMGELQYRTADYIQLELPITYSIQIGKRHENSLYTKVNGTWLRPSGDYFADRKGLQLSIGATF